MSIKEEVISLLTKNRDLTSAERAEIDMLGVALSLRDDDPSWGQIAWAWATLPRKEDFDIRLRAFAAEVRSDVQNLLASQPEAEANGISGTVNDPRIDDLKAMIKALSDRPVPQVAVPAFDQKAIQSAISTALSGKKALISADDLHTAIKESAREVVSWTITVAATIAVGICLYVGFSVGEKSQAASDALSSAGMKKQNADLEQQVETLTKLVGKNR